MNDKNNIPVKFISLNIVAVVSLIAIVHVIEPAEGVFTILVIFFVFAVLAATFHVISRLIEKSPSPIRAINDGLKEFVSYLWVAWIGWHCHKLYVEIADPPSAIKITLIIIAVTCICTVGVNYKKHLRKYKDSK